MLIDSHAHLDMQQFGDDLDEVISRAKTSGVGEILTVGYDPDSFDDVLALTNRFEGVYAAFGVHPHHAKDFDGAVEERLKRLLLRKKVLALGETGLDYCRDLSPRDVQRDVFRRQIGLALYFEKPIIVHCRDAFDDVLRILGEEGAYEVGGVFHAFSGGAEEAREVLGLGFLLGIGGPLTYRNSRLPDVVSHLPSCSILLETDCPYLPPIPYRGKRNEPAYVRLVAEKAAAVLGVEVGDIERATEVNYRRSLRGENRFPPAIAYGLRGNIYLNVTANCTNHCAFCPRLRSSNFLYGHNLSLREDPDVEEMTAAVRASVMEGAHREIVFCGFGEPTTRLSDIIEVAGNLRGVGLPVRLNTNGQGNLINERNIVPELEEVFDAVSISLNAHNAETYLDICRPDRGGKAFDAVLDFIGKAGASGMTTMVTALDYPGIDLEACRALTSATPGVRFRVRKYHFTVCEE